MTAHKQSSAFLLVGLSFFGFVLIGAIGGASGILIPSQIAYYHINKSSIGLIFFAFSSGYFLSAVSAGPLTQNIGPRRYLTAGAAFFVAGTLGIGLKPSFILLLVIELFLGFGSAIIDAGFNAAIATLPRSTKLLNYLHAFYGVGALLGPLVASAFLAMHLQWNYVYLTWCGLSLPLLTGCLIFLRPRLPNVQGQQEEQHNVIDAALKLSTIRLATLFLFLYVGIEVSVGNWSYSFLLEDRQQGTLLAGWIVSGYWLSLTLGRFLVNSLSERLHISVAAMIYCCLAGTGIGALIVWSFPGVLAAAPGFCIVGFALGPIFPTTIAVVPRLAPARLVPGAIGLLVGASVVGGALFPWLVGTLAQYLGTWILLPCTIALAFSLLPNWWGITRHFTEAKP